MPHKLSVSITRLRQEGWPLPRFRHATERKFPGILLLREEKVGNQHLRVARLVSQSTGTEIEELPRLHNAELVLQTAEEMLLAGFERTEDLGRTIDRGHEWRVAFSGLEVTE